jgi:hypothetical protein
MIVGMVILEPALVAPQPLFNTFRCSVESRLRILGFPGGVQHDTGVEMDLAISLETRPRFFHDHMT